MVRSLNAGSAEIRNAFQSGITRNAQHLEGRAEHADYRTIPREPWLANGDSRADLGEETRVSQGVEEQYKSVA